MNTDRNAAPAAPIFYASPLIFLAACGLLALIIAVFAVSNVRREKNLMKLALEQEAAAIINLVAGGSRTAMRRGVMRGGMEGGDWIDIVAQSIENSAEHPGLIALILVDQHGVIRAHSEQTLRGSPVAEEVRSLVETLNAGRLRQISAIGGGSAGGETVFRMAVRFLPLPLMDMAPPPMRGRMGRGGPDPAPSPGGPDQGTSLAERPFVLVAELSLDRYRQAIRTQIMQIVILSVVLLLVGTGGLLSLILIQTYKGSQRRLRSVSTFTDTLVAELPLGLVACSAIGEIRACNRSAARMLNLGGRDPVGRRLEEVLDEKVRLFLEAHRGEEIYHREIDVMDESGAAKTLHLTKLEIREEEEKEPGLMLLVQDLSQLRTLEEQLRRSEREAAVGRMAAGVAHELRNPLSSVKGLALLLKSRLVDDHGAQQNADLLVEEVERLNRSISELLDYARPGLINRSEFSIDELLGRAVTLVRNDAESDGITVRESYGCGAGTISGDQDRLTQVMLNLFLNGIQAMTAGGTLTVTSRCEAGWATVEIGDTGTGIAPEIRDRVFEPYVTTRSGGTGLGLAMSARIVADHQGIISLDSTENKGTAVTVRLPCQ